MSQGMYRGDKILTDGTNIRQTPHLVFDYHCDLQVSCNIRASRRNVSEDLQTIFPTQINSFTTSRTLLQHLRCTVCRLCKSILRICRKECHNTGCFLRPEVRCTTGRASPGYWEGTVGEASPATGCEIEPSYPATL